MLIILHPSDAVRLITDADCCHRMQQIILRNLFAQLLAEVQRIKSEGDFEAARNLVEKYGVKLNNQLHAEVLSRYKKLNIAPYKGFLNPKYVPLFDDNNDIIDISVDYSESLEEQMLRYSREYSLIHNA